MYIKSDLRYKIKNAKSSIHGRGSFAVEKIPARKKIGSMGGQVLSKRKARQMVKEQGSISMVELWNGKAIDASTEKGLRFINHSCSPNTYMRTFNYHVEFYALRTIKSGEELTCNYGPTHHDGKLPCRCGAKGCKGNI
jgi:uncharacterized protein